MRPVRLFASVTLVALFWIILAAAKGTAAPEGGGHEADAGAEATDSAADNAGSNGPEAGLDDLGEPPPARSKNVRDRGRASALNPDPAEFPDAGVPASPAQYDRLLGDIAALRSRVAALTTTLFASKLRVLVETEESPTRIQNFVVTLDDGVVFSKSERFIAEDEQAIYEHAVAPGHHVLGIEIERQDPRGKQYSTWQSSRFSLVVPEGKQVEAHLILSDDSDMAEDFATDGDGEYDLRARLRARVIP